MTSDLLTTAEAATLLGMTDSGVRRMILSGRLKATRYGRRQWLINREALLEIRRSNAGRPRKPVVQ